MLPVSALFSLLLACTNEDSGKTVDTALQGLAPPYLSLVSYVPPHTFSEADCVLTLDLFPAGSDTAILTLTTPSSGGEWIGAPIDSGTQYTTKLTYTACPRGDRAGEYVSGTFSLDEGGWMVAWFTGTRGGFSTLQQFVDYRGGQVEIAYEAAVPEADVAAALAGLEDVTIGGPGVAENSYALSYPTDRGIGEVLTAVGSHASFASATPAWIAQPSWW